MLRTDGGVIEPSGYGVSGRYLPVFVLKHVSVCAVENTGTRTGETLLRAEASGVFADPRATSTGCSSSSLSVSVAKEVKKKPNRIRASPHACEKVRGETLFGGQDLLARFAADNGLLITNHPGARVGT